MSPECNRGSHASLGGPQCHQAEKGHADQTFYMSFVFTQCYLKVGVWDLSLGKCQELEYLLTCECRLSKLVAPTLTANLFLPRPVGQHHFLSRLHYLCILSISIRSLLCECGGQMAPAHGNDFPFMYNDKVKL